MDQPLTKTDQRAIAAHSSISLLCRSFSRVLGAQQGQKALAWDPALTDDQYVRIQKWRGLI